MGKAKIVIGLGAVIAAVVGATALGAWALYGESGHSYVVIDSGRVRPIEPRAGMAYEYNLDAYDDAGNRSLVTFQTSRELRAGAYLELETKPIRGVVAWEELAYEDVPEQAREALSSHASS